MPNLANKPHSVYVRNLEERVKPETLDSSLKAIFEEFGNVVEIITKHNMKGRGQAFIVFDQPQSAKHAVEEVHGFELFSKPMSVALARSNADKSVELLGGADELDVHKKHRLAEKGMPRPPICVLSWNCCANIMCPADKKQALKAAEEHRGLKRGPGGPADGRPIKTSRPTGLKSTGAASSNVVPDEYLPPNRIIFLQNIPDEYDVEGLTAIYSRYEGFREVRLVPGRRGIAFVEYDAETGAIAAKEQTSGMTLGEKNIKVTYQRQ